MMTQLYDVFDEDNKFYMRGSLPAIQKFLHLHPAAIKRIKAECQKWDDVCKMREHDMTETIWHISRAHVPLEPALEM